MKPFIHNRWAYTILLSVIVLSLALAGGTWGTTQAARQTAAQAVPTITWISRNLAPFGSPDFQLIINGTNFGDSGHTRVRFYQWGNPAQAGEWELTPDSWGPETLVVTVPAALMVHPNLFSIVVINYIGGVPPVPTIPTVPTAIIQLPPDTPPVIDRDWEEYEEISNEMLFRVYDLLFYYHPQIHSFYSPN